MTTTAPAPTKVKRATAASWAGLAVAAPLLVVLALAPYYLDRGMQGSLVTLFSLVVMASMWNLLAGYGGMVSIGQQAYIGIGAYALVYLTATVGLDPFVAVVVTIVIAGLVAVPISFLAFRLSGGYFAIGTWVIAEVVRLVIVQFDSLGAGAGTSLMAFSDLTPGRRIAYVYWMGLAGVVLAVLVTYLLMRSRVGLGFTAIRDDDLAAASLGVRVTRSKRLVFVVAAMGTALAGTMVAANTLRVQPDSVFALNWTALMIFIVVIGGIGTVEGPIIGAVVLFALQQWLADLGTWYLIILGVFAIVITLFLPRGIWGLISGNGRLRMFPVGYTLVPPAVLRRPPAPTEPDVRERAGARSAARPAERS
jgi:branched-chain amino acid transport system permease protein